MFIKQKEMTEFGFGRINEDMVVGMPREFDFENNDLAELFKLSTFTDEDRGIDLFLYKNKLVTYKELQREYLKDYYEVKD